LTIPALATLAKGTSLARMSLVAAETLSLGTSLVSDTARATEVNVAATYANCQLRKSLMMRSKPGDGARN
jgi:hypothetical protein